MPSLSDSPPAGEWNFGPFRLERAAQRLWREGEAVPLRPKSFAVLCCLVEHAGRLVEKNQLLDVVWGHRHVSESALEGCISELRRVMGDEAKSPRYLETVARRGYRFVAEVHALAAGTDAAPSLPGWQPLAAPGHPVGRKAPLARLQAGWQEACRGNRQLLFLSGEAGLGKTTLIEMFLQSISQDHPAVLWGQCIDHVGIGEAFLPLLSALGRAGSTPVSAALQAKAPTWLIQLPALLTPEQRRQLQPAVLGATRERMLREGCELLETLSGHAPLIVVLEDLHWSDGATLDLLAWLGRRREAARLLVLGSYRPSDVALREHPLQRVQQELHCHGLSTELPLLPFTPAELRDYLALRFPDGPLPEALAGLLHHRTGGHPLFVVNLLDHLLAEGLMQRSEDWRSGTGDAEDADWGIPEDLRQLIERQISRFPPDQQRLLEAASAAGLSASAALLAAVLDLEPLTVEAQCERLVRQSLLLTADGVAEWPDGTVAGNYAFRHALYGEVLYQRLPPARRIALHQRLGERLEVGYRDGTAVIAPELARHFEEGRQFFKALNYLRLAAQQSSGRFANREARDYLGRALALVERLPQDVRIDNRLALLQERARVHRTLNDWRAMVGDLETLIELAREEGRRQNEVAALVDLSLALFFCDRSRCVAVAERAVERSQDLPDEWLKIHAQAQRAWYLLNFHTWRKEHRDAILLGVDGARRAQEGHALHNHLTALTICRLVQSDYRSALAAAQEVGELGLRMGNGFQHMVGRYFSCWALLSLGRWGKLYRVLAHGRNSAEQNASPFFGLLFHLLDATLHAQALDFKGAWALCGNPQAFPPVGSPIIALFRQISQGWAHLGSGRPDEGAACFGEISRSVEAGEMVDALWRLQARHGLAACRLAQRQFAQARTEANRLLDLAIPPGDRAHIALAHRLLAQIALAQQDWNEADAQVARALETIDGAEVPLAAWRVYQTAAEVYDRRGRSHEALGFMTQAASILQTLADSLGDEPQARGLRRSLLSHRLPHGIAPIGQERLGR